MGGIDRDVKKKKTYARMEWDDDDDASGVTTSSKY